MEHFEFKKKFGQNFIKNRSIVEKIVKEAAIPDHTLVLEVGPGKGILTGELAKVAENVVSYEIDCSLKPFLDQTFENYKHVKILYEDFMNSQIEKTLSTYTYDHLYFVANVPYYITTPILMKLMSLSIEVEKIVMMVQKEVGERFSATCGSRDYSSITVYLNYFFEIHKLFKVSKNEFIPQPKVDSIIVSFTRKKDLLYVKNYDFFFRLVRDSFQYKRKTIRNNLKKYHLETISMVLSKHGFSLNSRAEQIPYYVFVELANELV